MILRTRTERQIALYRRIYVPLSRGRVYVAVKPVYTGVAYALNKRAPNKHGAGLSGGLLFHGTVRVEKRKFFKVDYVIPLYRVALGEYRHFAGYVAVDLLKEFFY